MSVNKGNYESPLSKTLQSAIEDTAAMFISGKRFQAGEDRESYARDVEWLLTKGAGLAMQEQKVKCRDRLPTLEEVAAMRMIT